MNKYVDYIRTNLELRKFEGVLGEKIDDIAFIHKSIELNVKQRWTITEITTGMTICHGRTREDVINKYNEKKSIVIKLLNSNKDYIKRAQLEKERFLKGIL